jgi:hypothetical protein
LQLLLNRSAKILQMWLLRRWLSDESGSPQSTLNDLPVLKIAVLNGLSMRADCLHPKFESTFGSLVVEQAADVACSLKTQFVDPKFIDLKFVDSQSPHEVALC